MGKSSLPVDELAAKQLAALLRVADLLDDAEIEYWLFGGWAVDFYAGSVTRPHDDVDIAVWHDIVPRIGELLERDGWRHAPAEDEDGGTGYERDGVRLELTYLVRDGEGRVCIPLRDGLAAWPQGSFGDDVRELHGTSARLIGLASLRQSKSEPREEKDRADLARLPAISNRSVPAATVIPVLAYEDVPAAAEWLCRAFGFRERLRIGEHRVQLVYGDGAVIVTEGRRGGQAVHVRVGDADAHHAHVVDVGAKVVSPPEDYPYGERQYTADDLGGHRWTFSQSIADVDPESWGGTAMSSGDSAGHTVECDRRRN